MAPDELTYDGHDRRAPPSPGLGVLVAAIAAAIVFATLCPTGLRPRLGDANLERFFAFFALGGALCLFTPRRWPAALAFVVFLAFSLEAGQLFIPGRDARSLDAVVKALGGASGVFSVSLLLHALRGLRERGACPGPAPGGA